MTAVSKVTLNGTTLMDSTTATATASKILSPYTAMTADGVMTVGTASGGGWTTDGIAERSEPSGDIVITTTNIKENAFSECANITSVNITNATTIRGYSFKLCTGLVTLSMPNVISFASAQQFISCENLKNVYAPSLSVLGGNAFQNCTSLEIIDLPAATRLNFSRVFYGCSKLQTVILRNTSVVPVNNDCFTNTPFTGYNGLSGTVYVPQSLISSYQTASNWSTLYSGGYCTFAAIEGSIYE